MSVATSLFCFIPFGVDKKKIDGKKWRIIDGIRRPVVMCLRRFIYIEERI